MILQEEQITVQVEGLLFSTHALNGSHYRLDETAIDGWYDGVAMRRGEDIRPTKWGDFETAGNLGSRRITLTGVAIASATGNSSATQQLQAMRDEFMSVLVKGEYVWAAVTTPTTGTRYVKVGLDTAPKWVRRTDTFANFKMDLVAADPRIYSEEHLWTIPGRNRVGGLAYPLTYPLDYHETNPYEAQYLYNAGNVDAWPTITVTGVMPDGVQIIGGGGKTVEYRGFVSFSSPVVINFEEGSATQKGADRTSLLTKRNWFPVPPQEQLRPRLEYMNQGTGWMEVALRDTWI